MQTMKVSNYSIQFILERNTSCKHNFVCLQANSKVCTFNAHCFVFFFNQFPTKRFLCLYWIAYSKEGDEKQGDNMQSLSFRDATRGFYVKKQISLKIQLDFMSLCNQKLLCFLLQEDTDHCSLQ